MKALILSVLLLFTTGLCTAQNEPVGKLPAGKYESFLNQSNHKWEQGDLILLDENRYQVSKSNETGEYRFSVTAQRVFFTSGPLKGVFAKTTLHNNDITIIIPVSENRQTGLRLVAEVACKMRE
jgi:hypothetical protein